MELTAEPNKFVVTHDIYEYCDSKLLYCLIQNKNISSDDSTLLKKYMKRLGKTNMTKIEYKHSRHSKWGRLYPKHGLGLTMFPRNIRNTLCKDSYYDFDIVNAVPSILLSSLENADDIDESNYTTIKQYVLHRDELIHEWNQIEKNDWKTITLKIINGSNELYEHYPPFLYRLHYEIMQLYPILQKKNKSLYDYVRRAKETQAKINSSFLANYCFEIESRLIMDVIDYITQHYPQYIYKDDQLVFTYEFDGIKLLKSNIKTEDELDAFLNDINRHIQQQYQYVRFTNKPMDDELVDLDWKQYNELQHIMSRFSPDSSDQGIVNMILDVVGNDILYTEDKVWNYFNGERWVSYTHSHPHGLKMKLSSLIRNYIYQLVPELATMEDENMPDEWKKYKDKIQSIFNRLKDEKELNYIFKYMQSAVYNKEIEFDMNPNLIGFENGVFDLTTHEFRPYRYDDYVTMSVGYHYEERNEEDIAFLNELIRKIQPDEECRAFLLKCLSAGITGKHFEKYCLLNGGGANGKGLVTEYAEKALGDYFYVLKKECLISKMSNGANAEMANLDKKRFVVVREIQPSDKLQVCTLKEITGNTKICARKLYSNKCITYLNQMLYIEVNERPLFSNKAGYAEERRLIDFFFPSTFREENTEDNWETLEFVGDNSLKNHETMDRYKMSFLHILLDSYISLKQDNFNLTKPKAIEDRSKQFLKMNDPIYTMFFKYYEPWEKSSIDIQSIYKRLRYDAEEIQNKFYTYREIQQITKEALYNFLRREHLIQMTQDNRATHVKNYRLKTEYAEDYV